MKYSFRFSILVWCCFIFFSALGQTKKNISLADELQRLEQQFEVNFTYNYSKLGHLPLKTTVNCEAIEACLAQIKTQLPIHYEVNEEGNFMVLPVRKDIRFQIVDAEAKNHIGTIRVKVNQNQERYVFSHKEVFTLKDIFPLDTIHINSAFYEGMRFKAQELIEKKGPISMKPETVFLNEVLITDYVTKGIDAKIDDYSFNISMESLGLLAGETDGDIFNIIKNIPGIHTPSGKPGTLNFRGTTWDQTILQFDDIPIYHNGHFFGALSPFNPSIVSTIEIQRNMLHAKWGGRIGGLLHMNTSSTIPEKPEYEILSNTVFGGVNAKIPLVKDKLGFSIAGRSNYPGINSPKLTAFSNLNFQGSRIAQIADEITSNNLEVGFYDINSKLFYKINDDHEVSLSYINIQNRLSAELEETSNNEQDFRDLDLNNWGVSAKWEGKLSEKLKIQSRFSTSSLILDNVSEGFTANQRNSFEKYTNTVNDTRFITELDVDLNDKTVLQTGYTLTNYELTFDSQVTQDNFINRRDQNGVLHSLYASTKNSWSPDFSSTIGLHSDYYGPLGRFYLDPRVFLSLRPNNALYLKSSFGRSRQFIQKKLRDDFDDFNDNTQFWFLPDRTTAPLKSYQAMLGGVYDRGGWLFDVEIYSRNTSNVTLKTETEDLEPIRLKSIGADFFLKKRWNDFEAMMSYSLSETVTESNVTDPIYFDQRHILNFTALWYLNQWEFAATWGYYSGMPVVIPNFDNGPNSAFDSLGERFDNQHQLDLSATFSFPKEPKTWKGIIGLSFVNLYDRENVVNIFQNTIATNNPFRNAIRFSPNLQIRFRF